MNILQFNSIYEYFMIMNSHNPLHYLTINHEEFYLN